MRDLVYTFLAVWAILLETQLMVPSLKISVVRKVVVAAAVGLAHLSTVVLVAHLWTLPIPFTLVTYAPSIALCMSAFVVATLGWQDRKVLTNYLNFSNFVGLQMTMLLVYPAYAAFLSLTRGPQLVFVLLLPRIKIGFKLLVAKLQPDDDDFVPAP